MPPLRDFEGFNLQVQTSLPRAWGDREDEHDGAEPDDVDEPSLGWGLNREKGNARGHDWELDNCDRESDEPLLTECSRGGA